MSNHDFWCVRRLDSHLRLNGANSAESHAAGKVKCVGQSTQGRRYPSFPPSYESLHIPCASGSVITAPRGDPVRNTKIADETAAADRKERYSSIGSNGEKS